MRTKFTKTVSREIDNIYKEFEDLFTHCIHNAQSSCYDSDLIKISELTEFQIIRDNKFLEREFEEVINSIKTHLIEQLKLFEPFAFISFIKEQDENYNDYLPDVRKNINYKNYLKWIVGISDESILNEKFMPSEGYNEYLKYVFEIYQSYYEKLKIESSLLFENYKEIISKNYTKENEEVITLDFRSIFNPANNSHQVCIDMLEDLEITHNGTCRLTKGKASPLIGAISAMKLTPFFFKQDFTDMELLNYFNGYLSTDYKTFARRGDMFESNYEDAATFIKRYFKK